MMKTFTKIFDDPNRIRNARSRLYLNKQHNKTLVSWIIEIRRDAAVAGYTSYRYNQLKDVVLHNMNLELKKALVYERKIESLEFDEAVSRIQDVEKLQRSCEVRLREIVCGEKLSPKRRRMLPSPIVVSAMRIWEIL